MAESYDRKPQLATLRGMNLTLPGDRLSLDWCQVLRNLRCYKLGEWRQRPGLQLQFDTLSGSPILWMRRLNNPLTGGYKILVGTEAGGVWDETATLVDNGYGDQGYSSVVVRPDASPRPYLFLANAERQGKFDVNGARTEWGLASPTAEPLLELELPAYRTVDQFESTAGFTASGGSLTAPSRVSSTIQYFLYDDIVGRWACCAPAAMNEQWKEGMFVTVGGTTPEVVIIERVFPAIANTQIQAVAYDSGTNGPCCVQLEVPTLGLQRDMLLLLNGETVRVLSVTEGPDGVPSFRCSTVGTLSVGDSVVGLRSFRAAFGAAHLPGDTLTANYVKLACSGSGVASLTRTGPYDLSSTETTYNRPMQPDDFIHISLQVADWSLVTELQLQFDCDATTNDFTHNYFFKAVRPPDLQTAIAQTGSSLTAQQQQIQREQIDEYAAQQPEDQETGRIFIYDPNKSPLNQNFKGSIPPRDGVGFLTPTGQGPLSSPGSSGVSQWTELKIPIKEFERVGSDTTRGWQNIAAFRITANTTAAVDVGVDALWIGGTFGPDFRIGDLSGPKLHSPTGGLNYIYRMRNTLTGSTSAFSPPARSAVYPHREGVLVRGDAAYRDLQADVCDYFRIGGTLGDYHYVGTAPVSDLTFLDTIDDATAIRNEIAEFDRFKPWPTTDLPQSGICNVVGTTVEIISGTLDTSYIRNNQIIIGGVAYTFFTNPSSPTLVQINEAAGYQTGVTWQMPNPTMEGQPLPVTFGPYSGQSGQYVFGLGDPKNPGVLYYTIGNNPESCSDAGYIEISTPDDPLMGGCILDGVIYVWSTTQSWRIYPSDLGGQSGAGGLFYPQNTRMGKGLASSWALTPGDALYWVAWDGVWKSNGDAVESITMESLSPLFKHDGTYVEGAPYQGLYPISFSPADQRWLSLTYSKDSLYLSYRGIDGEFYNLVYNFMSQGWSIDTYLQDIHRFTREDGDGVDRLLAGSGEGNVYTFESTLGQDDGEAINCIFVGRAEDWGDTRAQKLIGDNMVDCAPGGNTLAVSLQLDNATGSVAFQPGTITGSGRDQFVLDLNDGGGWLARNAALSMTWQSVADSLTKLYEWQPAALRKPEYSQLRATDWDNAGVMGNKWLQGCRITCDTYEQEKTFQVQTDGAFTLTTQSVLTQGEQTVAFSWPPGTTHQMRIVGADDLPWRIMAIEWIWEPEPELARVWHTQFTGLDQAGYMHIRDMLVAIRSTSDVLMYVSWDEKAELAYTLPSTGGERQKLYVPMFAEKGKLAHFRFFALDPCSIYWPDCEVRVKSWGKDVPYQTLKPFGDQAHTSGAKI